VKVWNSEDDVPSLGGICGMVQCQ